MNDDDRDDAPEGRPTFSSRELARQLLDGQRETSRKLDKVLEVVGEQGQSLARLDTRMDTLERSREAFLQREWPELKRELSETNAKVEAVARDSAHQLHEHRRAQEAQIADARKAAQEALEDHKAQLFLAENARAAAAEKAEEARAKVEERRDNRIAWLERIAYGCIGAVALIKFGLSIADALKGAH